MCGIAGIINKNGAEVSASRIQAMLDAVAHRGPNAEGTTMLGTVALGHRRLAILDLSPAGAQPMQDAARGLSIIHNGEIYNYCELRTELAKRGYQFHSNTDTEVILAAYDAWGADCVHHFNGMWAFAIHDAKRNQIFCARDRFGIKPLYYYEDGEHFVFGSEIRQLLPFQTSIRANRDVVKTFLFSGTCELGTTTFFEGIHRLASGHTLTYDLATHQHHIARYYSIAYRPDIAAMDRTSAVAQLYETLNDAVKLHLVSDVKVGTCLSGGLDSSAIATLAARHSSGGPFAAITAVSEQASNNEEQFAQQVALHSKLDWYRVQPSYEDFANAMPDVVRVQEEPFAGPSIVMQYFVMQAARDHGITVMLDGQGADESLLGYERYGVTRLLMLVGQGKILEALREYRLLCQHNARLSIGSLAKYVIGVTSAKARYNFYRHQQRHLFGTLPCPTFITDMARASRSDWAIQSLDVTETSVPVLLRYEDKNAMAFGIETRLPFMDYRLVETAMSLPMEYKIHQGWTKWALRSAMEPHLPEAITWRKNKFGFEAPEEIWLPRHNAIMREAVLACPLLQSFAASPALAAHFDALGGREKFRLYSVALWAQCFAVS
ncbi:MAG: asparagine synthase (glutamine-hydrolyzing) [Rickettsiales bacterium]